VFFGVTFQEPIVGLVYDDGGRFMPGGHEEMIDNVTFGATIPEPGTSLLLLFGLITIFWSRHRGFTGGSN
jgi:hypothetical protein